MLCEALQSPFDTLHFSAAVPMDYIPGSFSLRRQSGVTMMTIFFTRQQQPSAIDSRSLLRPSKFLLHSTRVIHERYQRSNSPHTKSPRAKTSTKDIRSRASFDETECPICKSPAPSPKRARSASAVREAQTNLHVLFTANLIAVSQFTIFVTDMKMQLFSFKVSPEQLTQMSQLAKLPTMTQILVKLDAKSY